MVVCSIYMYIFLLDVQWCVLVGSFWSIGMYLGYIVIVVLNILLRDHGFLLF